MIDAFKLTAILISGVLWYAWLALVLRKKDVHPLRNTLDGFSRLGWMKKVGVLFIVVQLTMFGGAKHGGTNDVDDVTSTNDVELVEGGTNTNEELRVESDELMMMGQTLMSSTLHSSFLTFNSDSAAPYRLESVSTNSGISYALPADGTIRGTWHLTGAYEDVQKVTLDGFAFPLGSDLCTSLWTYTWGKVRSRLRGTGVPPVHDWSAQNGQDARSPVEIAAVGAPMSAIPDESRFWTAATSNGTYLLTWVNFAEGRTVLSRHPATSAGQRGGCYHASRGGRDGTVNAQIELFRNGDFITRSNDVECVYRRVIEPNPIVYPVNPPDPDDPTKPLYPYGSVQDLSVIEETNAYCWVDIVVDNADAWVRFEGDGASNLADPSFAAKAGETNHVVILIGKTYKVTCDMPFTVVGKSDPAIDERWENGSTLWLNWPVDIWARGDDEDVPLLLMGFSSGSHRGNGFTMYVSPSGLGGEFSWTNSCCAVSGSGLHFSYGCDGFCLCGGCSAQGYYGYEGYRMGCSGGSCGCSWYDDDDRHGEDDPDDPEPTPSISVSFDDDAVIYEDAYTNAPGNAVPWQSTTTKLHLEVHGGMKGGTAEFTFTNQEKLLGPDIPESISVPAGHCKKYEFTYRGQLPSGSTNDIVVTGTFTENDPEGEGDAATYTDETSTTSVKVELTPEDLPPMNPSPHRHLMGIAEKVFYSAVPSDAEVEWSDGTLDGGKLRISDGGTYFFCPWTGGVCQVIASIGDVNKSIPFTVCEPVLDVQNTRFDESLDAQAIFGESGWVGMDFDIYVQPFIVSFFGVYMEEIPVPSSDAIDLSPGDYFAVMTNVLPVTHNGNGAGAGRWSQVHYRDRRHYWTSDHARMPHECPPLPNSVPKAWLSGTMTWHIPVGWGDSLGEIKGRINPNPTDQVYEMEPNGTLTIRKYNHSVMRAIDGRTWLDGVPVNLR